MRRSGLTLLLAGWTLFAAFPGAGRAQTPQPEPAEGAAPASSTGALGGTVVDDGTGNPVADVRLILVGGNRSLEVTTSGEGRFRIADLPVGNYLLRVEHIAYGTLTSPVEVLDGEETTLAVRISPAAILLEEIEVTALSMQEEANLARGTRRNEVTREQIVSSGNGHLNLAEILRKYVSGVQLRSRGAGVTCLEYRGISSLQRDAQGCRSPMVIMDGVPIQAPSLLYGQLAPETIERMEFLSPAEAGARFGAGSMFGVLLIESRRPGVNPARAAQLAALQRAESQRYNWEIERERHSWVRVLATTAAANAAGLALGTAAAGQCITGSPRAEGYVSLCGGMATTGVAGVAVLVPALSSSLAARFSGATGESRGRLPAATALAALALLPGYGMILASEGQLDSPVGLTGQLLLLAGPPLMVTLADHLFRARH
jgi:hypothetical protein